MGSRLYGADGRPYLDFFAGAGALHHGHNNPVLKRALVDYVENDGVMHALDMWSVARGHLLEALEERILASRGLAYKVVFPGPAGANAVEAALKLARKATGRKWVAHFRNAFHGMTLGALAVNGNPAIRRRDGPRGWRGPAYDDHHPGAADVEGQLAATKGGLTGMAAVIVGTMQGEGGINVARVEWLRELAAVCRRHGMLLIVDDIQMGCGRVGSFFSFEDAGIEPDMACLSKSISGYGLPMALTLIRPELDVWKPAEHNGTFHGFNLAFVTAAESMRHYWSDDELEKSTRNKGERAGGGLQQILASTPGEGLSTCGRGLALGLRTATAPWPTGSARRRSKLVPPLTVSDGDIDLALDILYASVKLALATHV